MRERLGHDTALGAALEVVVADHTGGTERFVDVAGFDDVLGAIGMMRPDAGEEIGLQLEPDGEAVVFCFTEAAALCLNLVTDAEQFLDVMTDLVRDDVTLGEIAGRAEPLMEHPVETEVDVNAPIFRAVERTARAAGEAAARSGLVRKENELRLLVLAAHLPEELIPNVLGIGQNNGDELRCFIAGRIPIDLAGGRQLRLLLLGLNQCCRITAEKEVSDDEDDPTDPAAYRNAPAT